MAKIVLFEEQTLSFSYDEEERVWASTIFESPPIFTIGETYKVVWDGVTYTCVAQDADAALSGSVAVGNLTDFGFEGNNEPFIIVSKSSQPVAIILSLYDTAPSTHTVGVYQGEDVGYLIANHRGEDIAYFGVENFLVRTTEDGVTQSGQQNFTKGEVIEDLEITLWLKDGDMKLQAPEGYLVKSAIIKKPDTLVPENIAKNEEIAGVIGTHEGGGNTEGFKEGIYFEFLKERPSAHAYSNRFFEYKGDLYYYMTVSTSSRTGSIYKYENDTYTKIADIKNTDVCTDGMLSRGIEWNDKVYFLQFSTLVEWDGTNITVVNSALPFSLDYGYRCPFAIYNNEIYGSAVSNRKINLYKVNADFSTELVGAYAITGVSSPTTETSLFSINNELYAFGYYAVNSEGHKYWLCKFNGSEFEPYISSSYSIQNCEIAVVNNKLYMMNVFSGAYGHIVEFDLTNKTSKKIGNSPYARNFFSYKNELYTVLYAANASPAVRAVAKGHIVSGE